MVIYVESCDTFNPYMSSSWTATAARIAEPITFNINPCRNLLIQPVKISLNAILLSSLYEGNIVAHTQPLSTVKLCRPLTFLIVNFRHPLTGHDL